MQSCTAANCCLSSWHPVNCDASPDARGISKRVGLLHSSTSPALPAWVSVQKRVLACMRMHLSGRYAADLEGSRAVAAGQGWCCTACVQGRSCAAAAAEQVDELAACRGVGNRCRAPHCRPSLHSHACSAIICNFSLLSRRALSLHCMVGSQNILTASLYA